MFVKKPIAEIAEFIKTGKTPPTADTKYFNGDINWYTPGDLDKSKKLGTSIRKLSDLAIEDNKATVFPENTLLIGCIGDIGKLGITSDKCSSNQQITGIFPKRGIDVNYLYYWFLDNKKVLETYSNNAVVPILNNAILSTIQIPLPPLPIQQKIATILDAADAYRQKTKALIDKYDQLAQSLFLDMFGDPVKNEKKLKIVKLKDVTTKITDGVHAKPNYTESGVPFISVKDVTTGILKFDDCKFISKEDHDKFTKRCAPEYLDILYTKVGATYGRPAIIDTSKEFSIYVSVALIKPDHSKINPYFLKDALANPAVKKQADKSIKGIGVPDLHLNMIQEFLIPLPDFSQQKLFADRIEVIETQKQQAQASLQKAEELFNSLLQQAFNGELVG